MIRDAITGKRVLIVEDEPLVAMHLEDTLSNMGCQLAGSARTAAQAIRLLDSGPVDFAVLDINLGAAETSYPVADVLTARGIPFTFLTGYSEGAIAAPYRDRPRLQKPFGEASLLQALAKAFPHP